MLVPAPRPGASRHEPDELTERRSPAVVRRQPVMVTPSSPVDLLQMVRRQLAPAEGGNRLVPLVAEGRLPRERLAALAGEEYRIIPSDRRSLLVLAARFPQPPAVDFFVGLAQGESLALSHL